MKPLIRPSYDEATTRPGHEPWDATGIRGERLPIAQGIPRMEWRHPAELLACVPDVAAATAELWLRHISADQTPVLHLPAEDLLLPSGKALSDQLSGRYSLRGYGPAYLDPSIGQNHPVLGRLVQTRWWHDSMNTEGHAHNAPDNELKSVMHDLLRESLDVLGPPGGHASAPALFINRLANENRWLTLMMNRAQTAATKWIAARTERQPHLGPLMAKVSSPGMNMARLRLRPEGDPDQMIVAAIAHGTAHIVLHDAEPTGPCVTYAHGKIQRHQLARLRLGVLSQLIQAAGSPDDLLAWSADTAQWPLWLSANLPFHTAIMHHPRQRQSVMITAESLIPTPEQLPLWLTHLPGLPRDQHDLHATDPDDPTPLVALQVINAYLKTTPDGPQLNALYALKNSTLSTLQARGIVMRASDDHRRSEFEGVLAGRSEFGVHSFHVSPNAVLGTPVSSSAQEIVELIYQQMEMRERTEWIRGLISHVPFASAVNALTILTS